MVGSGSDEDGEMFTGIFAKGKGLIKEIPEAGDVRHIRFADGVIYTGDTTSLLKVWDIRNLSAPLIALQAPNMEGYRCTGLDVNDDVIVGGLSNWLYAWDKKTFSVKYTMKMENQIDHLRLSGTKLLCMSSNIARLYSFDVYNKK